MWPFGPNIDQLRRERRFDRLSELLCQKNAKILNGVVQAYLQSNEMEARLTFCRTYENVDQDSKSRILTNLKKIPHAIDWLRQAIVLTGDRFLPEVPERITAVQLISKLLESAEYNAFLSELSDMLNADEVIACYAAETLGYLKGRIAMQKLLDGILAGKQFLSPECGKAIARIKDRTMVPALIIATSSHNTFVRHGALMAIIGFQEEEEANYCLASMLEDKDRKIRKAAKHALLQMGDLANMIVEKHFGKDRARRVFPDGFIMERIATKLEQEEQKKKLEKNLGKASEVESILANLKEINPKNRWLHEEIITGWEWTRDSTGYDESLSPIKKKRSEAGDCIAIHEAAERVASFWKHITPYALYPTYGSGQTVSRDVNISRNRVTLTWRGVIRGEDGTNLSQKWRLSIVRLGKDEFLVLEEATK